MGNTDLVKMYNYIEKTNVALFDQFLNMSKSIQKFDEKKKKEFGFYFTVLSKRHLLGIDLVDNIIIDTHYLDSVHDKKNADLGVDAVFIDHEICKIFLYNFKHKDNYVSGQIDGSTVSDIGEFVQSLFSLVCKRKKQPLSDKYDLKDYNEKTRKVLKEIVEILVDDSAIYKLEVVLVSNVDRKLIIKKDIRDSYKKLGVNKINQLVLEDIYPTIVKKPFLNSRIIVSDDEKFTYHECDSNNDTLVSPMKISDLIRITNKDDSIKMNPSVDYKKLKPEFDFLVIDENVRGFIPFNKSSFNKEIIKTLETNPSLFFLYNNGVTIVADDFKVVDNHYANTEYELVNYQIVNGGQTIRSIYKYLLENSDWSDHLSNARILTKIIKTDGKIVKPEKIAEYTNSQNPISSIDIKTIDTLQIQLEKYLSEKNIGYIRKIGDTNFDYSKYSKYITMVKLGQLIYSKIGNPHKASNTRSKIFGKDYNIVFDEDNIYETSQNLIEKYYEIKTFYDSNDYVYSDQRLFYVIYLISNTKRQVKSSVLLVEKALREFDNDGIAISDARKLIKGTFKTYLDTLANIKDL